MNTTNWQKIKLKDIFEIYTSSDKNFLESEDGNIPYISSTQFNNGVSSFVQSDTNHDENTITVARNGSVGSAFYHSYNYCASPDDVRIFKPKFTMNKYIGLFLCTLIEKEKYRFTYGRKFGTKRMKETAIKLPVKDDKNIDWIWIDNYVKNTLVPKLPLKAKSVWNDNFDKEAVSDKKLSLNTENWQYFELEELFDIVKGNTILSNNEKGGSIPLVSSTSFNNGTAFFAQKENIPFDKNKITIASNGSVGSTFYQPKDFYATADTNILTLKRLLNPYIAMFLITIIEREKYRYNYGRKFGKTLVQKTKIKLPATKNKQPDWQFMEDYIKSLPYSKSI